jgi:uncharacterized CHY-type Zn-finger protein
MPKEYMRNWNLKKTYGISFEDKARMLARQSHKCAVCGDPLPDAAAQNAHLDHDHTTKKVRAVLCGHCNKMLGYAKDDPERLIMGAAYLELSKCL